MTFGAWLWPSDVTAGECCVALVNGRGPDKKEEVVRIFSLCFPPPKGKTMKCESQRSLNTWGACWIQGREQNFWKIIHEFSHPENVKLDLSMLLYTEAIGHQKLFNCSYAGLINSADNLNDNLQPSARLLPVCYRFIFQHCRPILITESLPRLRQL